MVNSDSIQNNIDNHKRFFHKLWKIAKPFWVSEKRGIAFLYLAAIGISVLGSTYLSVQLVYTQGNWINQLVEKNRDGFYFEILKYALLLLLYVPATVLSSFIKGRLAIIWREWLSKEYIQLYLSNFISYSIEHEKKIDNPDQRITEDIRTFTENLLDLMVDATIAFVQFLSFSLVLWAISPTLLGVAFIVSAVSTALSVVFFGKRLSDLNYFQNKKEADYRFRLVRVRENTESIAFFRGEQSESNEILRRLKEAISNSFGIVNVGSQYGLFFIGINMLGNIIPVLLLADGIFKGIVLIGTISKSQAAFGNVKNSFNFIIKSLKQLTLLDAELNRLYQLTTSIEKWKSVKKDYGTIQVTTDSILAFKNVDLFTLDGERQLTTKMNFSLHKNENLLIMGPNGCGKTSLLRLIAGLWNRGNGEVITPDYSGMFFIPQKPYMTMGSLRTQLFYPSEDKKVTEIELHRIISQVNMEELPMRIGGYDVNVDFANILSLGEQQRIGFARLILAKPSFVLLDEATSAMDSETEEQMYKLLQDNNIWYITVGHRDSLTKHHNKILIIKNEQEYVFSDC